MLQLCFQKKYLKIRQHHKKITERQFCCNKNWDLTKALKSFLLYLFLLPWHKVPKATRRVNYQDWNCVCLAHMQHDRSNLYTAKVSIKRHMVCPTTPRWDSLPQCNRQATGIVSSHSYTWCSNNRFIFLCSHRVNESAFRTVYFRKEFKENTDFPFPDACANGK